MPEYKHLPLFDKWSAIKEYIADEIEDWIKSEERRRVRDGELGEYKFAGSPTPQDSPFFSLKCQLERLEEREECEKWWIDVIAEQCHGDAALYIFKSLKRGEYTYPVRTDDDHKYTREEVLEHTVKVRYAEYMYKQASQTGGDDHD